MRRVRARAIPHSVAMPNALMYLRATSMRRRVPSAPSLAWTNPKKDLGRERKLLQRTEVVVIRARRRHRHVDIRDGMAHLARERVCHLHHHSHIARLNEMTGAEVAVAEVEAEFRDLAEHIKRVFDAYGPQRSYWGRI